MSVVEKKARALVVDDEESIRDAVLTALKYEGLEVFEAATGAEALKAVELYRPQVIVLDVLLPDLDGFEVARRLRSSGNEVPILFLTARDDIEDKVAGFEVGGDDYLTKPFLLRELVARVGALLRRTGELREEILMLGDLILDRRQHKVLRSGVEVELTPTEFRLLEYFMERPGRVLAKNQIIESVWGWDFEGDPSVLETFVSSLRKKLNAYGPPLIKTVRGVGYMLKSP